MILCGYENFVYSTFFFFKITLGVVMETIQFFIMSINVSLRAFLYSGVGDPADYIYSHVNVFLERNVAIITYPKHSNDNNVSFLCNNYS